MAKFQWEATNRSGETRRGAMEADSDAIVDSRLRADGLTPKRIKKAAREFNITFGGGVTPKELQIFTRQLATMIDAGLPLVQCLEILSQQTINKVFAKALGNVKSSVEQGSTFSDALRRHPKIFDELYVNLVAAGEVGGILDTILNRLAIYIEKAVKLKGQLKSAMIYPIAILCVAIAVVALMLWKVIPVFEGMYKNFQGAKLPSATAFVINLSHGFIDRWYIFVGSVFGLFALLTLMARNPRGRELLDAFLLRVPIIGPVLRKIVV